MASLLTNTAAMTALQTLKTIDSNLGQTQKRVSTGLKIGEAADNVAYWSISQMMRSDSSTLTAVTESLNMGINQIAIAEETTTKSKEYLDSMNSTLITAYEKGEGDVSKIQTALASYAEGISSAVSSATLAEKNILGNGGGAVRVAGSYRREGSTVYVDMIEVGGTELNFATQGQDGSYSLEGGVLSGVFGIGTGSDDAAKIKAAADDFLKAQADYNSGSITLTEYNTAMQVFDNTFSVVNFTNSDFTVPDTPGTGGNPGTPGTQLSSTQLEAVVQSLQRKVTAATQNVVTAGAKLGASKQQIQGQVDYVGKLVDAIDTGVGALVDADMNAESARLSSLQVQQQLGIQALSIANSSSQTVLALFQG